MQSQLVPDFSRVIRTDEFQAGLEQSRDAAVGYVDALANGILFLGRNGSILFANAAAQAVFLASDGLCDGPEGLRATGLFEDRRLQACIVAATGEKFFEKDIEAPTCRALTVSRLGSGRPYNILVAPIKQREVIFATVQPAAIVLIGNPDVTPVLPAQYLRQLYGLTKREAELAALVATGQDVAICADLLGITASTARGYLKRIYSKTDTSRQAELVHLLLNLPPVGPIGSGV